MKISNYLNPTCCVMNLKSTKKEDIVRELAGALSKTGKVNNLERFINDILERERLGSTGIGHNVAIPHSRTQYVEEFVIAFGFSKEGVDFNALDGEKVNFVFLMGANPNELNLYLRLLAELSKLLMQGSFRRELLSANKPEDIIELFKKFEQ